MPTITDSEFGEIIIRRNAKASHIKIRVAPDGKLRASLPMYTPIFMVKRMLKTSRKELREMLSEANSQSVYAPFQQIGKSHTLIDRPGSVTKPSVSRHGQQIIVTRPDDVNFGDESMQRLIREEVKKALRIEAKSYLPRRLSYLADKYDFSYQKVSFSHAAGRWGSCSSNGTISLNIALMKLPFELIDYVLIHELSHTKQMNHSTKFWDTVKIGDPNFKEHRRELKEFTPSV